MVCVCTVQQHKSIFECQFFIGKKLQFRIDLGVTRKCETALVCYTQIHTKTTHMDFLYHINVQDVHTHVARAGAKLFFALSGAPEAAEHRIILKTVVILVVNGGSGGGGGYIGDGGNGGNLRHHHPYTEK